jgi:hypothetical protein
VISDADEEDGEDDLAGLYGEGEEEEIDEET